MTQLESLRQEFEFETAAARKMLSIVPTDKFGWKPHPKSMSVKNLATHIAELPGWVPMTFHTDELDFGKNPYSQPEIKSTEELLTYFEKT